MLLVTAAVLCGQLSIGWSNDLVDLARDRAVGRRDKPLALGTLGPACPSPSPCAVARRAVRRASPSPAGWSAGLVHLVCVAAGWAYNLGLKATVWSWAPYAVAFGGCPSSSGWPVTTPALPPLWLPLAAACLGVGAHLLNVLPDIDDDARHRRARAAAPARRAPPAGRGRGRPRGRVGPRPARRRRGGVGRGHRPGGRRRCSAVVVLRGRGRAPFVAAVGIALLDVVLLVVSL